MLPVSFREPNLCNITIVWYFVSVCKYGFLLQDSILLISETGSVFFSPICWVRREFFFSFCLYMYSLKSDGYAGPPENSRLLSAPFIFEGTVPDGTIREGLSAGLYVRYCSFPNLWSSFSYEGFYRSVYDPIPLKFILKTVCASWISRWYSVFVFLRVW